MQAVFLLSEHKTMKIIYHDYRCDAFVDIETTNHMVKVVFRVDEEGLELHLCTRHLQRQWDCDSWEHWYDDCLLTSDLST